MIGLVLFLYTVLHPDLRRQPAQDAPSVDGGDRANSN
jgi:hypothetical protein